MLIFSAVRATAAGEVPVEIAQFGNEAAVITIEPQSKEIAFFTSEEGRTIHLRVVDAVFMEKGSGDGVSPAEGNALESIQQFRGKGFSELQVKLKRSSSVRGTRGAKSIRLVAFLNGSDSESASSAAINIFLPPMGTLAGESALSAHLRLTAYLLDFASAGFNAIVPAESAGEAGTEAASQDMATGKGGVINTAPQEKSAVQALPEQKNWRVRK